MKTVPEEHMNWRSRVQARSRGREYVGADPVYRVFVID